MLTKQRKTALSMQSTLFQVRKCRSLFSGTVCAKRSQSAPNVNKTMRASLKDLVRRELEMVEVAGVEPASCDGITPASTCLFCLFCLSSRSLAGRQAALRLVHLKSRPESMKKAYGPGRCRRHLPLAPVREVTSPHQAASAYSSFAVIGLIEFLRGQRSSSTCR